MTNADLIFIDDEPACPPPDAPPDFDQPVAPVAAPNHWGDQIIDAINSAPEDVRKHLHAGLRQSLADVFHADDRQDDRPAALALYPELPDEARLDPDLGRGAGAWLDDYLLHASTISPMTPELFHTAVGLVLASGIVARRLKVPMSFGDIFPNIFVLLLAPSTLWTKSTSIEIARRLLLAIAPHLLAARDSTVEAILSDLAGAEPSNFHSMGDADRERWKAERNFAAQRTLIIDEMSSLLASSGKDYNGGLLEVFLKLYDCDPLITRSTRGQGRIVVRNSCLTMLGAAPPVGMLPHLNDRLYVNGWWARFAMLTPETDRPEWKESAHHDAPELETSLRRLYDRLPVPTWPEPPQARAVIFGTGVHSAWARYDKACRYDLLTQSLSERLLPVYGRLPTQLLKVATLLAALDWGSGDAPTIELPHMARALGIVETWRASAHRVLALATQSNFSAMRRRLITIVSAAPDGETFRNIVRALSDKEPGDIKTALDQLVDIGELIVSETKSGSKGGRPTQRYRLA